MTEKGWNSLIRLLKSTKYGKSATAKQHETLQTSYYLMIISYIYMCLETIGYDSAGIYLSIEDKSLYIVEVRQDTYKEYARYPGKWQTWKD